MKGRSTTIGKGDKQDVICYSDRCMAAIKKYLAARAKLDGATGKPLPSLPLFCRHGKSAGKGKVREIQSDGMWLAVKQRVREAGANPKSVRIHDFRNYFVTCLYTSSNDLLATKEGARHASMTTTQRYAHISDERVDKVFDDAINRCNNLIVD